MVSVLYYPLLKQPATFSSIPKKSNEYTILLTATTGKRRTPLPFYRYDRTDTSISNILELVDFEAQIKPFVLFINRSHLSLTGVYSEAELEVARSAFHAVVPEEKESHKAKPI
jgi:hypothetical protein